MRHAIFDLGLLFFFAPAKGSLMDDEEWFSTVNVAGSRRGDLSGNSLHVNRGKREISVLVMSLFCSMAFKIAAAALRSLRKRILHSE